MSELLYRQRGFTLIELMIVILVIAVLSAIAVPSYRQFVIKNAEGSAKAQMGQIELQLERWRASSLSYRGFEPMKGMNSNNEPTFGYDNGSNTLIFVPLGSNADNYRYQIELFDGSTNNTSLVSGGGIDIGAGRSWVMVATPNTNSVIGDAAKVFVQRSTGMKCATRANNSSSPLSANVTDCNNANWETW